VKEADAIAMRYFRADECASKGRATGRVTQADHAVEEMARTKVAASGLPLDVLGEEMGAATQSLRALRDVRADYRSDRRTEEFSRGIPTFGTLMELK